MTSTCRKPLQKVKFEMRTPSLNQVPTNLVLPHTLVSTLNFDVSKDMVLSPSELLQYNSLV
jgi:hypothetical protein